MKYDTSLLHGNFKGDAGTGATLVPVYQSSAFGQETAEQIEKIHNEYVSVIQYNNENSLSSVLAIAYLSAMQYYFKPIRKLPTGRGFADFVYIPKPEYKADYPA